MLGLLFYFFNGLLFWYCRAPLYCSLIIDFVLGSSNVMQREISTVFCCDYFIFIFIILKIKDSFNVWEESVTPRCQKVLFRRPSCGFPGRHQGLTARPWLNNQSAGTQADLGDWLLLLFEINNSLFLLACVSHQVKPHGKLGVTEIFL